MVKLYELYIQTFNTLDLRLGIRPQRNWIEQAKGDIYAEHYEYSPEIFPRLNFEIKTFDGPHYNRYYLQNKIIVLEIMSNIQDNVRGASNILTSESDFFCVGYANNERPIKEGGELPTDLKDFWIWETRTLKEFLLDNVQKWDNCKCWNGERTRWQCPSDWHKSARANTDRALRECGRGGSETAKKDGCFNTLNLKVPHFEISSLEYKNPFLYWRNIEGSMVKGKWLRK